MCCNFQTEINNGQKKDAMGSMKGKETGYQLTSLDKRVNTSPPLRKSSIKYSFPSV